MVDKQKQKKSHEIPVDAEKTIVFHEFPIFQALATFQRSEKHRAPGAFRLDLQRYHATLGGRRGQPAIQRFAHLSWRKTSNRDGLSHA